MSSQAVLENPDRREFLENAATWSALAALVAGGLGLFRMPKPNVHYEPSSRVRIGFPDEFPAGTSRILAAYNIKIVREKDGIHAVSLICTHLGCVVQQSEDGFKCPCHGSLFDGAGTVLKGPAPKALPWLALSRAEDGALVVDLKQQVKPGTKLVV